MINIPQTLQDRQQWVCWRRLERDGRATKVPFSPEGKPASVSDPGTWTDFETALNAYQQGGFDGIGFVLTQDDGIVCVDLDHARNGAGWKDEALEIVRMLDTYTEISPSGDGLHVWAFGKLPNGRRRNGKVEMYDSGRFITVTGDHLPITPTDLQERTAELMELHRRVFGEDSTLKVTGPVDLPVDLSDNELIQRAMDAENGAKFRALWHGDTSGYASQSEADLALCRLLAFWCGNDPARIERLFLQSALGQREKWRTRGDYRHQTIQTALQSLHETYNGNGHRQNPRQSRQNGLTDAEPSGTHQTTPTQTERATDEPGATGNAPRKPTRPAPEPWQSPRARTETADTGETESADTGGVGGNGWEGSSLAGEAAAPVLAALEDHSGELSPLCGDSTPSTSSNNIVRPNKNEMIGYISRNDRLHSVKCSATNYEMIGYTSRNDRLHPMSVPERILVLVGDRGSVSLADLLALVGGSVSAVRQALHRLVRSGKLVRRGTLYSLPTADEIEGETPAEYAKRLGISENAARIRLGRMVDSGRALRLAHGQYFILPDNWKLAVAKWDPRDRRRDQRGREYYELELSEPVGHVRIVRFYVNDSRYSALCEASNVGLDGWSVRIAVARRFRRGRTVYDCVAIVDKSGSRLLWREREKD